MDEENLKKLWLDAGNEQNVKIDADKLVKSLMNTMSKFEKKIRRRDRIEITVGVLMIPLFGWLTFTVTELIGKIGAAIILINCIVTILKLNRARKVIVKEHFDSEVKNQLETSLKLVRQQIKLLDSVLWWYLLPFFIGVICLTFSSSDNLPFKVIYSIIIMALYGFIWYLNKRAVKRQLKPLESNMVKALQELDTAD